MKNLENRFIEFDFIKLLAYAGVCIGHTYISFFETIDNAKSAIWRFSQIEAVCVHIFFIISGVFIAMSIETKEITFEESAKKLFSRLYPPTIFMFFVYGIIAILKNNMQGIEVWWAQLFMLGSNVNGLREPQNCFWFVIVFFWTNLFIRYFLIKYKIFSVCFSFPLFFLFAFSFLYSKYGSLGGHAFPLFSFGISLGFINSIVGMIFGVEIYYLSLLFKQHFKIKKTIIAKFFCLLIEIVISLLIIYIISRKNLRMRFLIYPTLFILFFSFLIKYSCYETLLRKIEYGINKMMNYSFMFYLCHLLLIENQWISSKYFFAKFFDFENCNRKIVYLSVLILCYVLSIIMQKLYNIFFFFCLKIKKIVLEDIGKEDL